jgi:hypothetical protein
MEVYEKKWPNCRTGRERDRRVKGGSKLSKGTKWEMMVPRDLELASKGLSAPL